VDYQGWDKQLERDIANSKLDALAEEAIYTIAHILMKKELDELEDELRPEYNFAQMQGGVKGKYVQGYQLVKEEEPILQTGATYEIWSPLDSHEAAHKLAQLLESE
jgi:hypothetical protein